MTRYKNKWFYFVLSSVFIIFAATINKETGEEIEGQWEVYRNGKPLLDKAGKPITYPSNSQVGTKGFEYGF